MRPKYLALALFLLLGVAKLPLEQSIAQQMRESGSLAHAMDLRLRDNLGQMAFAATLGGLRSLVASLTYLQAFTAFERSNWAQVESLHRLTTQLQPRYAPYWDDGSTRLAYDAASFYLYDTSRPTLYRNQLYRQNFENGVNFAEEGLQHLPDSKQLHERLAEYYFRLAGTADQKALCPPDYRKAGEHYLKAWENGGLPVRRLFAAYAFSRVTDAPDLWKHAYHILMDFYNRGYRSPTSVSTIKELEKKLQITDSSRINAQTPPPPSLRR